MLRSRYITLQKGQAVIMYASLIHCGGPSSGHVIKKATGLQYADTESSITEEGYHIYLIAGKPPNAKKQKMDAESSVSDTHGVQFCKRVMVPQLVELSEMDGKFVIE